MPVDIQEEEAVVISDQEVSDVPAECPQIAKYWQMRKAADSTPEIMFYGEISEQSSFWSDDITPKQFAADLDNLGPVPHIRVRINSPGGDLFAANAIYNILKNHPARITAYVDGIAASAASVVLMAGDEIVLPRNAMVMIHNPMTVAWGDARDFRKIAENLDIARETIIAVYEAKTGLSREKIISLLNSETWLTAKESISLGFADRMDEQMSISACISDKRLIVNGMSFDASKFQHIPESFAPSVEKIEDKVPSFSVRRDGERVRFEIWCPFIENGVKEDERMVYGYSTLFGVVDADGHRMTRQAIEDALPEYAEFRNVRERHSLRAVGTAPVLDIDDKGLMTGVYISTGCEDVWRKCKDRTYKGFSLGGDILKKLEIVEDGKLFYDLVKVSIDEITLCDRPKCPGAVYQVVIRQGGALMLCSTGGGDNAMAEGEKTQELQEGFAKAAMSAVMDWIRGDGKDEVTAALGINVSNFATKEDFDGIKNSVGDLTTKITDLLSVKDKPVDSPVAVTTVGDGKGVEAADPVAQDSVAEAVKMVDQFKMTMSSMTDALKNMSDRMDTIESARGMRKSMDAVGSVFDDDKEELWKNCVPGPRT